MTNESKFLLGTGIVTILILIGAIFFVGGSGKTQKQDKPRADAKILVRPDSYKEGSSSAKVTVVEFGDFQCPACGSAHPVLKKVVTDYKGKIQFVFRNYPLPMHQNARVAAEAAEAAGAQGKYWEMHDKLYENQNQWSEEKDPLSLYVEYAKEIGLNVDQFKKDVEDKKFDKKLERDIADGNMVGVAATPTIFVNGVATSGVPGYDDLKAAIDSELNKK